jgi:hypothetical protein
VTSTDAGPVLRGSHRPSLGFDPAILPRLAFIVPVVFMISPTFGDPDLWGHVKFGLDILRDRAVSTSDPYSFTSDVPWVNHEWLAEALFGMAYAAGGAAGLTALRLVVLATTFLTVAAVLGRSGVPPLVRALMLACVMAGTNPIAQTVRPQLFSLAAFACLLSCVVAYERHGGRALWPVPLLMIPWANLHGGMLVGLGSFGVWTAVTLGMSLRRSPTSDRNRGDMASLGLAILGLAALAATLVNPYGAGLWRFLADTVSLSRADISEWQPLHTLPAPRIGLWILAVATGTMAAVTKRISTGALSILVLLAYASFRVRRLDGFFIIATAMLCAPALGALIDRMRKRAHVPAPLRIRPGLAAAVVAAAAAAVWMDGTVRPGGRFGCINIRDERFADPAAARFVTAAGLRGRMLTWFNWGEYALWHFSPNILVSMDGRRETVYSEELLQAHLAFYNNRDRLQLVNRLQPDFIWLPTSLPVVPELQGAGWHAMFNGESSVVLARTAADAAPAPALTDAETSGCFPGP